jgi:copper resistance protein B
MRWTLIIAAAAPVFLAAPALAQADPPAMQMTWPTTPPPASAALEPATQDMDHGAMDHGTMNHDAAPAPGRTAPAPAMQGMDHGAMPMPQGAQPPTSMQGMDHGAMDHGAMTMDGSVGNEPPPPAPTDHAAERFYSAEEMAAARRQLRREHGGAIVSNVMVDMAELRFGDDATTFHWEGEGWIGGDINRFVFKTEGEAVEDDVERAEVQALYSRAIGPYFDLQAGVRYDIEPSPNRAYAVLGFEGVAPYWFETTGALFVSDEGEVSARLEGSYDARLTQRVILQPRAEINLSADDIPELALGSGVTDVEFGLRLRYDITRNFSPYVGFSYAAKLGDTADYASAAGKAESDTSLVFGIRARF